MNERTYRLKQRGAEFAWIMDNTKDELVSPIFTSRQEAQDWHDKEHGIVPPSDLDRLDEHLKGAGFENVLARQQASP